MEKLLIEAFNVMEKINLHLRWEKNMLKTHRKVTFMLQLKGVYLNSFFICEFLMNQKILNIRQNFFIFMGIVLIASK